MPVQTFTATGVFTAPANISGTPLIECIGRGGTGANGDFVGGVAGGGGGGGGYSNRSWQFVPGMSYPVTIDNASSRIQDFNVPGDILCQANKGGNGSEATPGSGGSLSGVKGDVKCKGGDGGVGFTIVSALAGGGGGGACGSPNNPPDGTGHAGQPGTETAGGLGGDEILFRIGFNGPNSFLVIQPLPNAAGPGAVGGTPNAGACAGTAGANATLVGFGGGGGGGSADSGGSVNGAGGNGAPGMVRITYDITILS